MAPVSHPGGRIGITVTNTTGYLCFELAADFIKHLAPVVFHPFPFLLIFQPFVVETDSRFFFDGNDTYLHGRSLRIPGLLPFYADYFPRGYRRYHDRDTGFGSIGVSFFKWDICFVIQPGAEQGLCKQQLPCLVWLNGKSAPDPYFPTLGGSVANRVFRCCYSFCRKLRKAGDIKMYKLLIMCGMLPGY